MKVKTALAVSTVLFLLVALKFLVRDHNYFFIASEFSHFIGIVVLIYKLSTQNSCAGNFLVFYFCLLFPSLTDFVFVSVLVVSELKILFGMVNFPGFLFIYVICFLTLIVSS